MPTILETRALTTRFFTHEGVVRAVNGISFSISSGEIVGIVGESGSGKSVAMLSILRLIPEPPGQITAGEVIFRGQNLLQIPEHEMERIRGGQIGMIFQDPGTSLNPTLAIGSQVGEALRLHLGLDRKEAAERSKQLLELVGIPDPDARLQDYPHQFSGGMRQRVMIAMALSCNPSLLIADEPTTALDVTVQAQIVELVKRLHEQMGMTIIWITHDLGVVARLVERVMVMYAGLLVEDAPVDELYGDPRHPYTLGLLGSLPRLNRPAKAKLWSIPGQPPDLISLSQGCPFAPRCNLVTDRCRQDNPPLERIGLRHKVACWEYERTEGKRTDVC